MLSYYAQQFADNQERDEKMQQLIKSLETEKKALN